VGIVDDITFTSLPTGEKISLSDESVKECLFYGLGADGTVGANKNSIKIIGDKTELYAQAYFAYDSKKSGGYTRSHLRFGKKPIRSTYLVSNPHFVACSVAAYLEIYDVIDGIREGGTFLLNSIWDAEQTVAKLPNKVKKILASKKVNFYIINATDWLANLVPQKWQPENYIGFNIPGQGFIIAIFVLLITGVFAANMLGRKILEAWDTLLGRIPVVKSIYSSVKKVSESLLSDNARSFQTPVLIPFPQPNIWTIAFVSGEVPQAVAQALPDLEAA